MQGKVMCSKVRLPSGGGSGPRRGAVADPGGAPIPKLGLFCKFFAKSCMKMKEFGPRGARPWRPLISANEGGLPLGEDTWYWHLVMATAAVGTHASEMHS